jgi:hypothetical protein
MLAWFRAHASHIATTAMVFLVALGASTVSPHVDDCHESGCLTIVVEHDADAHRFTAPPEDTDTHPLHCLVCHLLRSFRLRTEARVLFADAVEPGGLVHFDLLAVSVTVPATQPPLRAPPASPFV